MADYMTLSNSIWAGNIPPLYLYYYTDTSKFITVKLLDANGKYVSDTSGAPYSNTYPVLAGFNTFNIGDWLMMIHESTPLREGEYLLEVYNGSNYYYLAFIVSSGVTGISAVLSDADRQYIEKIEVYDKLTGVKMELPRNTEWIPYSDRLVTAIYLHNSEKRVGRVILHQPGSVADTGWCMKGMWRFIFTFDSKEALLGNLISRARLKYIDEETLSYIFRIIEQYPDKAIRLMEPYGFSYLAEFGRIAGFRVISDDVARRYAIEIDVYATIGDVWGELNRVLESMIRAVPPALAMAGTAVAYTWWTGKFSPAIGFLTFVGAWGIFTLINYFTYTPPEQPAQPTPTPIPQPPASSLPEPYARIVEEVVSQTQVSLEEKLKNLQALIEQLYSNGDISVRARDVLKQSITAVVSEMKQKLEEMKDQIKAESERAYKDGYNAGYNAGYSAGYREGYKKAQSEQWKWIMLAGGGGLLVGLVLGRR